MVTGGAGYIGHHVAKYIEAQGCEVVTYDNLTGAHCYKAPDIQGDVLIIDACDLEGIDAVVHVAAWVSVAESMRDPISYWTNNVRATDALLSAMRIAGTKHLVFLSSAAVYAPSGSALREDSPLGPTSVYGLTKYAAEKRIEEVGIDASVLRLFNVVGWGHVSETHLLPCLIAARKNERIPSLYLSPSGHGTCVRDYVHVLDVAKAVHAALTLGRTGTFNIGTGVGHSTRYVWEKVMSHLGPSDFSIRDHRPGDVASLVSDPSYANVKLGWMSQITLEEAIMEECACERAKESA